MFACIVCNARACYRPSDFIGHRLDRFVHMMKLSENFWAGGLAEDEAQAVRNAIEDAYELVSDNREDIGDYLIDPIGFMVEVNSATETIEGSRPVAVEVDLRRSSPLRIRYTTA